MAEPTQRNAVLSCLLLVQKIEKFSMTIVEEDRKKVFREKRHTFHGVIKGETITHGPVCYWLKNHIQEI